MRHVVIIHPEGNVFTNPTLKALIDLLRSKGVLISLLYKRTIAPVPVSNGVTLYPWGRLWNKFKLIAFNKLSSKLLCGLVVRIESLFGPQKYDLIIGVDREGLIQAYFLSLLSGKPYTFISFEIMFSDETSFRFKLLERIASDKLIKWFVQDHQRARLIASENGLDISGSVVVPLASKGLGSPSRERLRDMLSISPMRKVAMVMGSLSDWTMTADVLRSVDEWSNDWCVIVHDRYGRTRMFIDSHPWIYDLIARERIYVSDFSTSQVDEMDTILSGVDVGIAFYRATYASPATGRNLAEIGFSSGKISTFLRYGIPVVMNNLGLISDLARLKGFGLVVGEVKDIGRQIDSFDIYAASRSARSFFSDDLDFANYEANVWRALCHAVTAC